MSNKISVILTRSESCPHCINFMPIFKLAKNICKNFDELKNYEVKFEDYNLEDNAVRNTFMITHLNLIDKVKGYPTVFINFKNNYDEVEHTVINGDISENVNESESESDNKNENDNINENDSDNKSNYIDKQYMTAAKKFIENISNVLKSRNSDNKILFIQQGGNNDVHEFKNNLNNEESYKNKYHKYKSKYIELKNNMKKN